MSTSHLKEFADKLSPKEGKWLSAYLAAETRASDPEGKPK